MIDIIIVSSFLILLLVVGIYNRSRSNTLSSYSHLGKDINSNSLILAATIFASAIGGGTTFGISEKAFSGDLSFAFGLILTIPIDIGIAIYLVPRLSQYQGVNSAGEIVGKYYGRAPRIITGLAATLISIGYLSVQINVSGRIFSSLFGLNYIDAVIISYVIVIIYTAVGGLRSVVLNNSIQFIAMIIGIPALTILGIKTIGIQEFLTQIPKSQYDFSNNSSLIQNTLYAALSFSVMGFYPTFIQRVLAGRNAPSIQRAIYIKSSVYFAFIICLTINGLLAKIIVPNSSSMESLTDLINTIIPQGMKALVLLGFLSAVMSTADSDLNVAAISLVNDILRPLNMSKEKDILFVTKLLTMIVGSSVVLIVLQFEGIVELVIFSAGLWSPTAGVTLLAIMLGRKTSDTMMIMSSTVGVLIFLITEVVFNDSYLSGIFLGTIASALIVFYNSKKFEDISSDSRS